MTPQKKKRSIFLTVFFQDGRTFKSILTGSCRVGPIRFETVVKVSSRVGCEPIVLFPERSEANQTKPKNSEKQKKNGVRLTQRLILSPALQERRHGALRQRGARHDHVVGDHGLLAGHVPRPGRHRTADQVAGLPALLHPTEPTLLGDPRRGHRPSGANANRLAVVVSMWCVSSTGCR